MMGGDLTVSQARERLRFLDNEIRKPKSKPDRHASRVISHLDHVLAELENLNLMAATSTVQGDVLKKVQETRRVLKDLESGLIPVGQVE